MENKTIRSVLLAFVVVVLVVCAFGGGFAAGHFLPSGSQLASPTLLPDTTPSSNQGGTPKNLQTVFTPFWQAWTLVHQVYIDQPVNDTQLMQGAIRGMLDSLGDPHTLYLDPQETQDENNALNGGPDYEGIGAWVDIRGEYLTIVGVMPGSPAEKAGLLPGDQIVAIDGQDMTGVNPETAHLKVLGKAGTTVTLTILRAGVNKPFDVQATRAKITPAEIEYRMLDNNIAYVRLFTFGDNATADVKKALQTLMAKNPKGLILDLRNNTGGLLDAAVGVGSQFVDQGPILIEQYADRSQKSYVAKAGGLATKIPMVVLINGYSASASEIVAGTLQDDGRAKLVGVKSYGKGTVQYWIPLDNNQGEVAITNAKWLTANGRTIDKVGLTPDLVVEMTPENTKNSADPQLDAAKNLLLQETGG